MLILKEDWKNWWKTPDDFSVWKSVNFWDTPLGKNVKIIIGYNDSEENKWINTPLIFLWVDKDLLLNAIGVVCTPGTGIGILKFEPYQKPWDEVITEWKWDCNYFFLLLGWKLGIYKKDIKVATIGIRSVVWEIWFFSNAWRTAEVRPEETCFLLPLDKFFIASLTPEAREQIKTNLISALAEKLDSMNDYVENLLSPWKNTWKITNGVKGGVGNLIY